jgi:hypothetical protein
VNRRYFSNDSYAITGLVMGLNRRDQDTLVWFNLDRVAHATGRSRTCDSCHGSTVQAIHVTYDGGSYEDVEDGEYRIVADEKGLRVTDFRGPGGGPVPEGLKPFQDHWKLSGDFSLPKVKDAAAYQRLKKNHATGGFTH